MEVNKKIEEQRFEFLLYINGHIICQRYFHIKGFNEKSLKSFELHNMVFECVHILKNDMKEKTREYLWKYYQPYKEQVDTDIDRRDIYEKIDDFKFEVRVDKKPVIIRGFNGNQFPPKVRYQIDIKDIIHDIIGSIRHYLTLEKYTYNYVDSDCVVEI
jgi:hypothetical protein